MFPKRRFKYLRSNVACDQVIRRMAPDGFPIALCTGAQKGNVHYNIGWASTLIRLLTLISSVRPFYTYDVISVFTMNYLP